MTWPLNPAGAAAQRTRPNRRLHAPRLLVAAFCVVSALFGLEATWASAGVSSPGQQCLHAVGAELISQQRLGGSANRLTGQFESALELAALRRLLQTRLRQLAAPGHLMQSQTGPWSVYSYWQDDALCMVQIRANGLRSRGLVSATHYSASTGSAGAARAGSRAPAWWPALPDQRVYEWIDGATRVTTVVVTMREPAPRAAQRLTQAAARAGLGTTGRYVARHAGPVQGSALVFEGADERATVTLFPVSGGTGVVAHIQRSASQ